MEIKVDAKYNIGDYFIIGEGKIPRVFCIWKIEGIMVFEDRHLYMLRSFDGREERKVSGAYMDGQRRIKLECIRRIMDDVDKCLYEYCEPSDIEK